MNPLTLAKLQAAGDVESSKVLEIIHADEITREFPSGLRFVSDRVDIHPKDVTTGHRWFTWL